MTQDPREKETDIPEEDWGFRAAAGLPFHMPDSAPGPPPPDPPGRAPAQLFELGERFALGERSDCYGIWDTRSPGEPVKTFERTYAGWVEAAMEFASLEPDALGEMPSKGVFPEIDVPPAEVDARRPLRPPSGLYFTRLVRTPAGLLFFASQLCFWVGVRILGSSTRVLGIVGLCLAVVGIVVGVRDDARSESGGGYFPILLNVEATFTCLLLIFKS